MRSLQPGGGGRCAGLTLQTLPPGHQLLSKPDQRPAAQAAIPRRSYPCLLQESFGSCFSQHLLIVFLLHPYLFPGYLKPPQSE
jgi:hypothetical protein